MSGTHNNHSSKKITPQKFVQIIYFCLNDNKYCLLNKICEISHGVLGPLDEMVTYFVHKLNRTVY